MGAAMTATRTIAVMALMMALAGCGVGSISNDTIIIETKKCHDAGLDAKILLDWNGSPERVVCFPKEQK